MAWQRVAILSVVLNGVLGVSLIFLWQSWSARNQPYQHQSREGLQEKHSTVSPAPEGTVFDPAPVRESEKPFHWSELESTNFMVYVENLRKIGCPELTIRDLVTAEIDQHYSGLMADAEKALDLSWWQNTPGFLNYSEVSSRLRALESERNRVLGQILESSAGEIPKFTRRGTLIQVALGQGFWESLTPAQVESFQSLLEQTLEKGGGGHSGQLSGVQQQQSGPSTAASALEIETRQALGEFLDADQIEEVLLRYSKSAGRLRLKLAPVDLDAGQFRKVFRKWDQSYRGDGEMDDEAFAGLLQSVTDGETSRFWEKSREPGFQRVLSLTENAGIPRKFTGQIHQIEDLTDREILRIHNHSGLSETEKRQLSADIQASRKEALSQILEPDLLRQYEMRKAYRATRESLDP